ncbi:LacI family DNA-binding transcriptional regulator [Cellulomonas sp. KRMCY2]|uniref:LacI family DNA-binding transcriptional regulator n=1 Tax=Cellulomonas sp. KRMCY2 TaxID=1304865 RepID=UPI0018CC3C96|nr:LacI family DNA-binding transcriptional regulator [Cellulomonas sp. KRMCY2]
MTARDVARVAGVSVSTVSRALAKPDSVSQPTRDKVLQTARGMGYRPNLAARGLITGRTGTIALIVPDLENPFFAAVAKGVQSKARTAGYAVIIADSDEDPSQEADLVRSLAKQVDGVLLCSPRAPDSVIVQLAQECTIVLVNRRCGDIPTVAIDNLDGVRQAVMHLRALGHRTIAYVGGPSTSWSNRQRIDALRNVATEHTELEVIDLGSFQPYISGGIAAADLVIASGATAVLAYNDLVALGILKRLRQRGVHVPADISVVGVDDIPMSMLTTPALTSVGIPLVNCGRAGVDMLLSLVREPSTPPVHHHDLSFRLVVRESTGPCPTAPPV